MELAKEVRIVPLYPLIKTVSVNLQAGPIYP